MTGGIKVQSKAHQDCQEPPGAGEEAKKDPSLKKASKGMQPRCRLDLGLDLPELQKSEFLLSEATSLWSLVIGALAN
jgi:hypothetical protein